MYKYKKMFENEVKGIFEDAEVVLNETSTISIVFVDWEFISIYKDGNINYNCKITLDQSMKLNTAISNYFKYSQGGAIR